MGAYNDDVLMVHIPKTAGTAVKHYMVEHLPDVLWPLPNDPESVEKSKLPIGHIPLRDIEMFTGRPLDSWELIIGVVRNPYHQQASQWLFWRERYAKGHRHPHDMVAAMHPSLDGFVQDPESEFHRWYEHRMSPLTPLMRRDGSRPYADYGGMYAYWMGVDGGIPDNVTLLRQETLAETLPLTLEPFTEGVPADMEYHNVGPSDTDYMAYYGTWEAIDAVEARFRWTFDSEMYPKVER